MISCTLSLQSTLPTNATHRSDARGQSPSMKTLTGPRVQTEGWHVKRDSLQLIQTMPHARTGEATPAHDFLRLQHIRHTRQASGKHLERRSIYFLNSYFGSSLINTLISEIFVNRSLQLYAERFIGSRSEIGDLEMSDLFDSLLSKPVQACWLGTHLFTRLRR